MIDDELGGAQTTYSYRKIHPLLTNAPALMAQTIARAREDRLWGHQMPYTTRYYHPTGVIDIDRDSNIRVSWHALANSRA